MKDYLNEIDGQIPVRRSDRDKETFRSYVSREADALGYPVETAVAEGRDILTKAQHHNIVIGRPENACVVFTAHYDTPRRALFPNLMLPLSKPLKYAYLFLTVIPTLAAAICIGAAVRSWSGMEGVAGRLIYVGAYLIVYFCLFFLLFRGPSNRHNRNDNTSGVSAVLTLASELKGDPRAAFILFDNEEKGKLGSKAYAAANPDLQQNRLVVNLDCVGNGDTFIVSASESAMKETCFAALSQSLSDIGAEIRSAGRASLNSDQKSFAKGIGICACRHHLVIGYYTPRIHTVRDTVASPENIRRLTGALAGFVNGIACNMPET